MSGPSLHGLNSRSSGLGPSATWSHSVELYLGVVLTYNIVMCNLDFILIIGQYKLINYI